MIRKMLMVAAATILPVTGVAAVGIVATSGVAGAKGSAPTSITCGQTGTAKFAKPGLTHAGALTNKSTETTAATLAGSGTGCDTKTIKLKITTATTPCAGATSPAPICSTAPAKTLAKDPNYYNDAAGYASSASDIGSSLPIEATDNGTKVWLEFGTSTSESPGTGDTCGTDTGFHLTGNLDNASQTSAIGTYTDNVCIVDDSGAGTTGDFYLDLLHDVGGAPNPQSTITGITLGGADSSLVITIP
jgi:hypothetical protein